MNHAPPTQTNPYLAGMTESECGGCLRVKSFHISIRRLSPGVTLLQRSMSRRKWRCSSKKGAAQGGVRRLGSCRAGGVKVGVLAGGVRQSSPGVTLLQRNMSRRK